jgi:hypothetical protein
MTATSDTTTRNVRHKQSICCAINLVNTFAEVAIDVDALVVSYSFVAGKYHTNPNLAVFDWCIVLFEPIDLRP